MQRGPAALSVCLSASVSVKRTVGRICICRLWCSSMTGHSVVVHGLQRKDGSSGALDAAAPVCARRTTLHEVL